MNANRILLVDDSSATRKLCTMFLRPLQAQIDEAASAEEALDKTSSGSYDLVVTDVEMPGMDGLELCARLKREAKTRAMPVLVVSTLDTDADIDRGFEAGATRYLPKPFTQEEFCRTVGGMLQQNLQRREQVILVVDDSETVRGIVERALAEAGFPVLKARNGRDALDVLESCGDNPPSLILSDLNMPEMDGWELCAAVRSDARWAALPYVTMSTQADRGTMRRLMEHGASSFLTKPFSADQLLVLVEKLLDDHVQLLLKDKENAAAERRLLLASIMSLARALDARDAYTHSHSRYVASISSAIARRLQLDAETLEGVDLVGQLHDIGKIGIRDSILLKPDKLSDPEFQVIKKHPVIGHDILKHIPSLENVVPGVRHHHEKWNGKGYPDGLAEEQIPLVARLIAVGDVWHALTSDRPYRKAMPLEKALGIMREERGEGLCPTCLDAFFVLHDAGELPPIE